MRAPTLTDRIVFTGYRLLSGALSRLPGPLAEAVAWCLGILAGSILRIRRGVVDDNLAHAFPHETPAWRARVARGSYRHLVREALATARLTRLGSGAVARATDRRDYDLPRSLMEEGRGLVIFSGHLGNWEVGGAALPFQIGPTTAVGFRQRNPLFNRDVVESRKRHGLEIILRDEGPRPMLRALRAGRALALLGDQHAGHPGIWVEYFGRPASTARGPAVLAQRSGAPLVLGVTVRVPSRGSGPRYRTLFTRIAPPPPELDPEAAVHHVTQACQRVLEEHVREWPDQYFWHHKRWKWAPPPDAVPGALPEPSPGPAPDAD
jgi:KDO2-lipid IV(A) lauroyltransferase